MEDKLEQKKQVSYDDSIEEEGFKILSKSTILKIYTVSTTIHVNIEVDIIITDKTLKKNNENYQFAIIILAIFTIVDNNINSMEDNNLDNFIRGETIQEFDVSRKQYQETQGIDKLGRDDITD